MPYPYEQQQLDPALVEQILAMQQQSPQQAQLARQLKLADQIRAAGARQMQGQGFGEKAGRVYVAPGLLNLGANLASQYRAKKLEDDAAVREQNMTAQRIEGFRRFFGASTGRSYQPGLGHMGDEGE